MKDDPGKKPTGAAKKTGFYAAIYGAAGIMLALAVIIGFRNFSSKPLDDYKLAEGEDDETTAVANDTVRSYLAPDDRSTYKPQTAPSAAPSAPTAPKTQTAPTQPQTVSPRTGNTAVVTNDAEDPAAYDPAAEQQAVGPEEATPEFIASMINTFTPYDESTAMMWPIMGDVVMDYSVDHVIYDKTLDQYRVNDTLCIAASAGEVISAAADGRVVAIISDKEHGKQVVVDNGNGWTTTYSQLSDGIYVGLGDVVTKGQAIGAVGTPSIYSILLGDHLGFSVAKDDNPVNPMDLLAAR